MGCDFGFRLCVPVAEVFLLRQALVIGPHLRSDEALVNYGLCFCVYPWVAQKLQFPGAASVRHFRLPAAQLLACGTQTIESTTHRLVSASHHVMAVGRRTRGYGY